MKTIKNLEQFYKICLVGNCRGNSCFSVNGFILVVNFKYMKIGSVLEDIKIEKELQ